MRRDISDYAFSQAIKELKQEKRVKSVKAKGPGNKRLFKLIE